MDFFLASFFFSLCTKCEIPKPNRNRDPRTEVRTELWAGCIVASLCSTTKNGCRPLAINSPIHLEIWWALALLWGTEVLNASFNVFWPCWTLTLTFSRVFRVTIYQVAPHITRIPRCVCHHSLAVSAYSFLPVSHLFLLSHFLTWGNKNISTRQT